MINNTREILLIYCIIFFLILVCFKYVNIIQLLIFEEYIDQILRISLLE